ncbi:MAG: ubiquinol oxidase subunit II [Simkaniaceae bacterium]|nr:MAG: ubiquinol oxidase subunit II [Simkaniaceae bacterium]
MKKTFITILIILLVLGASALTAFYISTHNIAMLEPKGLISDKERDLIVTCSLLMLIVVIPVLILTFVFAWRYREGNEKSKHTPDWEHNYIAEMCWWGVPFVIITILAVITWKTSHELDPFKPLAMDKKPIEIQAVALDWKWLFIYPEQGIATVNLVQFPEKTPINFEITADAPMNSFWIPQLGGQIYAMPAMRSKLHLLANEQGSYSGRSTNINGKGFSGMIFTAKSTSEEEFSQWVDSVKGSPKRLTIESYNELVKPSEYDPVSYYVLSDENLFNKIIMKYMTPTQSKD